MKPKNAVMLLLTSLIWGTAFVAQSVGMDLNHLHLTECEALLEE